MEREELIESSIGDPIQRNKNETYVPMNKDEFVSGVNRVNLIMKESSSEKNEENKNKEMLKSMTPNSEPLNPSNLPAITESNNSEIFSKDEKIKLINLAYNMEVERLSKMLERKKQERRVKAKQAIEMIQLFSGRFFN